MFSETRSARKTTSLFQAPKFIYGDSNFEFIILNFEFPEGVTFDSNTTSVFFRLPVLRNDYGALYVLFINTL
jgi:hypothetical protein